MPRKFLKRYLPAASEVRSRRSLRMLGELLQDPNIWHLTRRSVSTAVAVGVFVAFVPVPFQMLLAAALAVALHCNLPLAVALVWISNPFTMPPMFFFTYRVGTWLLQRPPTAWRFEFTWEWLGSQLAAVWLPLLLGSLVCGAIAAALAWALIQAIWRVHVTRLWQQRRAIRLRRDPR